MADRRTDRDWPEGFPGATGRVLDIILSARSPGRPGWSSRRNTVPRRIDRDPEARLASVRPSISIAGWRRWSVGAAARLVDFFPLGLFRFRTILPGLTRASCFAWA